MTVFGENAGQQCVGMSLCALIYSKITKITSVDDMTQIMILGIQLYSSLTGMVTVFEQFSHLEYSDSYTCNIHGDPRIEGYHHCISHSRGTAFETLLALNYNSFILTMAIIGVGIYSIEAGDIMYLILRLEICIITVIVQIRRDVYCWKYHL